MYFKGPNKKFTSSEVNKKGPGYRRLYSLIFSNLGNPNLIVSK